MKSKVLVTGGLGFIGSHLVQELLKEGYQVSVIDNMQVSQGQAIKPPSKDDVEVHIADVRDKDRMQKAATPVDVILHLAALISVGDSLKNPEEYINNNIGGTASVLEAAAAAGSVEKVILASSAAVYDLPSSVYAVTKKASEDLCEVYTRTRRLNTMALRMFNAYGSGQRPGAVVPNFVVAARNNKAPIIWGNGKPTRDFLYVKDICRAFIWAMNTNVSGALDIGTGTATTARDLWYKICSITGKKIAPDLRLEHQGVWYSTADTRQAAKIGFTTQWDLNAGLKDMLAK